MSKYGNITTIPTELLKRMRNLCPTANSKLKVSIEAEGKKVELTKEMRANCDAELKRRKQSPQ